MTDGPSCIAGEMALHLAIRDAPDYLKPPRWFEPFSYPKLCDPGREFRR